MRNKLAKTLRRKAEQETIGKPKEQTKKLYRQLKDKFKTMTATQKFETLQFFKAGAPSKFSNIF